MVIVPGQAARFYPRSIPQEDVGSPRAAVRIEIEGSAAPDSFDGDHIPGILGEHVGDNEIDIILGINVRTACLIAVRVYAVAIVPEGKVRVRGLDKILAEC